MIYADVVDRLRERQRLPLFADSPWDPDVQAVLRDATPDSLFPDQPIADPQAAVAAIAGLRLWNDDFTGAHTLAQGIPSETGSYLHGLCHRREGHRGEGLESNLANARYWFRRTGRHPAFDFVYRATLEVLEGTGVGFRWATEARGLMEQQGEWDPFRFIDWVDQAERGILSAQSRELLEEMQWREVSVLTDWCAQQALGE